MPKRTRLRRKSSRARSTRMTKLAAAQIGDGKTPNKYWVSVASDYYLYDPKEGTLDWASDLKKFKVAGKTLKQFDSYEEAKKFADSIELGSKMNGVVANTISIEDRLSGQVYERSIGGHQTVDDIGFTKKQEKKLGVPSTLRKKSAGEVTGGNLVNYIMAYEDGSISKEDYLRMFAYLIKTGQAWSLQGSLYGRPAADLIESGAISKKGVINWKKVDELEESW